MTVGIAYVDGPRLARSLHAASEWVAAGREEINRINVFPVPDGDTGTNFSLTLRSVADALQALGRAPLPVTARTIARAAVLGARGNSGMMLAHFLMGFAEGLGDRPSATAQEMAAAIRHGADRLTSAIDEPREGTILTVVRDAAAAAERAAADDPDVGVYLQRLLEAGERTLAHTPELLSVLKEAGVVDAGGKGFVRMIEGVVRFIRGDPILPAPRDRTATAAPAALVEIAGERDYQFCTEALVEGMDFPPANEVRGALRRFGGSLVVAVTPDLLKVHIHTDTPEAVFTFVEQWGSLISRKAEDMREQHRRLAHERRAVAVVADSAVDLPDAVLDRYRISLVPLQVMFGDETFLDRIELRPEEFYRRLQASETLPTTSQPAPAQFIRVFREALDEADEVVAVLVSGALSGTVRAATAVVTAAGLKGVHIVDSKSASLGEGLLALRGAELAEEGWGGAAIVTELNRVRHQSGILITVDRLDNLLRSGRVSRGRAWLAGMMDVKPILALDDEGRVVPVARVRGRDRLVPKVLSLLESRLTPKPKAVRFGIVHAEAPAAAARIQQALVAAYRPRDCFVSLATGVLGTHVGPGAWAVCYQVEDPASDGGLL